MSTLTDEEAQNLATLIEKAKWSRDNPLPLAVFLALTGNVPCAGVDLALIRYRGRVPEVLLALRGENDPYFANMWHLTGAMVVQGATALSTINDRVLGPEIDITLSGQPEFLEVRDILKGKPGLYTSPRGQEVYRLFQYVLKEGDGEVVETDRRKFFPLNQIPRAFIAHQWLSIERLCAVHKVSLDPYETGAYAGIGLF